MHQVTRPVRVKLRLNSEITEFRAQNFLASFYLHVKSPRLDLVMKPSQSRFRVPKTQLEVKIGQNVTNLVVGIHPGGLRVLFSGRPTQINKPVCQPLSCSPSLLPKNSAGPRNANGFVNQNFKSHEKEKKSANNVWTLASKVLENTHACTHTHRQTHKYPHTRVFLGTWQWLWSKYIPLHWSYILSH